MFLGTLTNAGTVTALSLRKAYTSQSQQTINLFPNSRENHETGSGWVGRAPYPERRPPANFTKQQPAHAAARRHSPPRHRKGTPHHPPRRIGVGAASVGRRRTISITHVANRALGQAPVPAVLDAADLAAGVVDEDLDDRRHDLLLLEPLDDVLVAHVERDGVARVGDAVVLQLDRPEERGQPVELRRVLGVAGRDGDVVGEGRVGAPEAEFREAGVAFEELGGGEGEEERLAVARVWLGRYLMTESCVCVCGRPRVCARIRSSWRRHTSNTEPTVTFCFSDSSTPGAVLMLRFLMSSDEKE